MSNWSQVCLLPCWKICPTKEDVTVTRAVGKHQKVKGADIAVPIPWCPTNATQGFATASLDVNPVGLTRGSKASSTTSQDATDSMRADRVQCLITQNTGDEGLKRQHQQQHNLG